MHTHSAKPGELYKQHECFTFHFPVIMEAFGLNFKKFNLDFTLFKLARNSIKI
jgi:hypothetical protein